MHESLNTRPPGQRADRQRSSVSTLLIRLTIVSSLGGLLFGIDTGVISGALVFLRQDLHLTSVTEAIVVTSLLFPGATAGALFGGPIADRLGRRWSLIGCAIVFVVAVLGSALSPDVTLLVVARIILGFAVGCSSVACPLYLAEVAPAHVRGRVVTTYQLMLTVGLFVAFGTNVLLSQLIHSTSVWRYMIGIAVVPAVALLVGMPNLPDSPRWYASKGRLEQSLQTLRLLNNTDDVDHEYQEIIEVVQRDAQSTNRVSAAFQALRSHPWMRRLLWIGIILAIAQQTTGINVVQYYAPTVLADSGMTNSASLVASLGVGIEQTLCAFIGIWLLGPMSRRKMMLIGFFGVALSHCLLALTYLLPQSSLRSYLIMAFMVCVSAMMVTFVGSTGFLVISELFPLAIRGFAMGASLGGLWLANSTISFLFPILAARIGSVSIFAGFMVLNILAGIFVLKLVPETKGKTLEELESDFQTLGTRPTVQI